MRPEVGLSGLLLDYPYSGSAVYTRNLVPLLPAAAPDLSFRLFTRKEGMSLARDVPYQRLASPFQRFNKGTGTGTGAGARVDKFAWETLSLPLAARRRRESLLHSLYFAAPLLKPVRTVVTIHDLIPVVVEGYHRSRASAIYTAVMTRAVRDVAAVITVSEHSRQDILRHLRVSPDRVFVTPEAADERFTPEGPGEETDRVRTKYRLPERFLLYLGGSERRKNLLMLVRAWAQVARAMADREVGLVVVATFPQPDPLYPDVPATAAALGVTGSIKFLPVVEEVDKPAVYRAALGFCFPSLYEGFGLTPLEAMASGVPVITSRATSLPEVVGDSGWLLDPADESGWAEAMVRLVDDDAERAKMRLRGLTQARTFSWRRTAEQTAEVYRKVLGE